MHIRRTAWSARISRPGRNHSSMSWAVNVEDTLFTFGAPSGCAESIAHVAVANDG